MTRVCATCKQVLGEKCPRCGSTEVQKIVSENRRRALFGCQVCKHWFREGDGGDTHTICDPCREALDATRSKEKTA